MLWNCGFSSGFLPVAGSGVFWKISRVSIDFQPFGCPDFRVIMALKAYFIFLIAFRRKHSVSTVQACCYSIFNSIAFNQQ
jgi:hypothetical protein